MKVYTSASGPSFMVGPNAYDDLFYRDKAGKPHRLYCYGFHADSSGATVRFQNTSVNLGGRFTINGNTLTLAHTGEEFTHHPDAIFDPSAEQMDEITRFGSAVYRFDIDPNRVLYISHGPGRQDNKLFIGKLGEILMDIAAALVQPEGAEDGAFEYRTDLANLSSRIDPASGHEIATWGHIPVRRVEMSDYDIHEAGSLAIVASKN